MTEQVPSKELIQRLTYCVNGCQFNGMPNTADICLEAIAEIERLNALLQLETGALESLCNDLDSARCIERLCGALRAIGECISGHDSHLAEDIHALLAEARAFQLPKTQADKLSLCKFYGVKTLEALVDAQARHIESLQSKLPPARDEFPRTPREG